MLVGTNAKGWERDMIGLMHDLPNDKKATAGRAQDGGGGILQKIILLTIPALQLQLKVLGTIKTNIEGRKAVGPGADDSSNGGNLIKQLHDFAMFELHALSMIFDKPRKVRSLIDREHEEKLKADIKVVSDKVASGSVSLIEAHETVIKNIIEILNKAKDGKPTPGAY
jgi:hypothetical protein